MARLIQCDRCKFTQPVSNGVTTVSFDQDREWELCESCAKFVEKVLCDGGTQYEVKKK